MAQIPARAKRFTVRLVSDVHCFVSDNADGPRASQFAANALHYGSDLGRGTRYMGFGGKMHTEHGGFGARAAIVYLYGIASRIGVRTAARRNGRAGDLENLASIADEITGRDPKLYGRFYEAGVDYAFREGY